MKKITLMIALLCSLSAFSMRYLVQSGLENDIKWRTAAEGETLVDLNTSAQTFQAWFAATTMTSGDEVWIAGGTYVVGAGIALKDGVNIYGGFAGTETATTQRLVGAKSWEFTTPTILDYNLISPTTTGLNCAAAFVNPTVVDGLYVTKVARAVSASGNGSFAGIIGTITLKNCKFYDNSFTRSSGTSSVSGGIFARTGSKIENCFFYNNQTLSGDPASIANIRGAALALAGDVSVKGCTFENNTSISNGGAVIIMSNTVSHSGGGAFENCIFKNNTAGSQGGAIHCAISQNQTANFSLKNCQFIGNTATLAPAVNITNVSFNNYVSIEGCLFENNVATTGTGAIFIAANTKIIVKYIKNCIFRGNKNATAGLAGAALHLNSPTTVSNCVFANNSGLNTLYLGAKDSVYNCTFANNDSEAGGAVLNIANFDATLKNNIFWGNTTNNIIPGTGVLTTGYNAYDKDESTQLWYGEGSINTLTATNTFTLPTSFVGAPTTDAQKTEAAAADWKLKSGAPAIDAGTAISVVTTDITGGARPAGSAYDMGAYEFGAVSGIGKVTDNNVKIFVRNSTLIVEADNLSKIEIFNLTGIKVYGSNAESQSHQIQLHKGVYLVRVSINSWVSTQKLMLN